MSDGQPRVLFVEREIRAFRLGFLRRLTAELSRHGIELVVVEEEADPTRGSWDRLAADDVRMMSVPARVLRVGRRELVWAPLRHLATDGDLVVMPQQTRQLALYPLLLGQRRTGPLVALWGHGVTPSESGHPLARALKQWLSTAPHWWFAYTEGAAEIVASFGYPGERITVVHNATDTSALRAALAATTDHEVADLRSRLGLEGRRVALFAGSLREDKKLGFLIDAIAAARQRVPDLQLVVAGDGREAPFIREAAGRHAWIHPVGPRLGTDLAVLLRLSEVIVVPSWVGLVVVDGFAAGVPLIASASADHPPEVDYIDDGVNGVLVDDDGDPLRYGAAVAEVLLDEDLHARLREGAYRSGERYSAERMAREFAIGIVAALAAPVMGRRPGPPRR